MNNINEFEAFIRQEFVYKQNLISVIQNGGHQQVHRYQELAQRYTGCSIKLEGMERYSRELAIKCAGLKIYYDHTGPVTCHAYRAYPGSESFPSHSDPMPVFLEVVEGVKHMIIDGEWYELHAGDHKFIPAGTPHEAVNQDDSLMLSFGLEDYLCST